MHSIKTRLGIMALCLTLGMPAVAGAASLTDFTSAAKDINDIHQSNKTSTQQARQQERQVKRQEKQPQKQQRASQKQSKRAAQPRVEGG